MTFLMVDLDNSADCKKAIEQLRVVIKASIGRNGQAGKARACGVGRLRGNRGHGLAGAPVIEQDAAGTAIDPIPAAVEPVVGEATRELPLRAKLERMKHRGVWRHLVAIAKQGDVAKSLGEFDKQLDFQPNKMRSLKAIMAKLENRFGLRFLKVAPDAGSDDAGNPRYSMPHRIRNQILRIAE
ncbi:MAG: hypothetical protein ABL921_06375 [Pirellula sp.]